MLRPVLLALALALPLAAQAQVDASVVPDDAPEWLPMGEAIERAQAEDKLIVVHGYASWCGWCAKLDQDVYTDDAVQAYLADNFTATRLDLEDDSPVQFFDADVTYMQLGQAMGITGTPTTVFVDTDGTLITKLPGYTNAETFLLALRYVREAAYETQSFDAFLEANRPRMDQTVDDLTVPAGNGN